MRLRLVEEDARIARFAARGLREQAYAVAVAETGDGVLNKGAVNNYTRRYEPLNLAGQEQRKAMINDICGSRSALK